MPSSSKPYDYFYDLDPDLDDSHMYTSKDPCLCQRCEVHYANGELCSTCIYNDNVHKHGIPDFNNEHWMRSSCETGQRLRRQYETLHIIAPDVKYQDLPYPVYLPSLKYEPATDICGFRTFYKKGYTPKIKSTLKSQPKKTWGTSSL